jgi:hypothetical protein
VHPKHSGTGPPEGHATADSGTDRIVAAQRPLETSVKVKPESEELEGEDLEEDLLGLEPAPRRRGSGSSAGTPATTSDAVSSSGTHRTAKPAGSSQSDRRPPKKPARKPADRGQTHLEDVLGH